MCLDVWQDRLIHYVSSNGVIYLVMADDSVGRRMPFAFLADLERRVCLISMCHCVESLELIIDFSLLPNMKATT